MNRVAVQSSNIASIGYESETKTLEVEFIAKPENRVYRFVPVPHSTHEAIMTAPSIGRAFYDLVRSDPSIISIDVAAEESAETEVA